jgi:hypothetical protein
LLPLSSKHGVVRGLKACKPGGRARKNLSRSVVGCKELTQLAIVRRNSSSRNHVSNARSGRASRGCLRRTNSEQLAEAASKTTREIAKAASDPAKAA